MANNIRLELVQNVYAACQAYPHADIAEAIDDRSFQDHYPGVAFRAALAIKDDLVGYLAARVIHSGKTSDEDKAFARPYARP